MKDTYILCYITKENKVHVGSRMGSCYSDDLIAQNHTHTDITTGNTEKLQQKYRHGTVSNRLLVCVCVCVCVWRGRGGAGLN